MSSILTIVSFGTFTALERKATSTLLIIEKPENATFRPLAAASFKISSILEICDEKQEIITRPLA